MAEKAEAEALETYYRVRRGIGYLGFLLPLVLIGGGLIAARTVEPSISDYYHTIMRDLYVAVIAATGVFLLAYSGYRPGIDERMSDDRVATIAGLAALGVAFFPNIAVTMSDKPAAFWQLAFGNQVTAYVHYVSAFVFLSALGYMSYAKFSRTDDLRRRAIYRRCGLVIYAATAAVVVTSAMKMFGPAGLQRIVSDWLLILWAEAVGIWAFSLAWLTKGRADESLRRLLGGSASSGS